LYLQEDKFALVVSFSGLSFASHKTWIAARSKILEQDNFQANGLIQKE
jgi:hypothetical protein